MMKKLVYISILSLLLLSSCRSKRVITVSLPQPIMQADSAQLGDTIGLPARLSPMFTFDQSDLRNVRRQPAKGEVKKQQIKKTAPVQKVIVQRGTRITSKTTHVGSAYKGVSRIKTYDFTHRDVPAAFEGFRIAFVSDLHYKSLLKEEGLKDLVRLLIDQKADVLLIGGDFHEGCQYVPPVMAALAQVKTPLGTYAVLGNNDYEACYDDIVREMRHYGMHLLEHKVDTLRRGGERRGARDHLFEHGLRRDLGALFHLQRLRAGKIACGLLTCRTGKGLPALRNKQRRWLAGIERNSPHHHRMRDTAGFCIPEGLR